LLKVLRSIPLIELLEIATERCEECVVWQARVELNKLEEALGAIIKND